MAYELHLCELERQNDYFVSYGRISDLDNANMCIRKNRLTVDEAYFQNDKWKCSRSVCSRQRKPPPPSGYGDEPVSESYSLLKNMATKAVALARDSRTPEIEKNRFCIGFLRRFFDRVMMASLISIFVQRIRPEI